MTQPCQKYKYSTNRYQYRLNNFSSHVASPTMNDPLILSQIQIMQQIEKTSSYKCCDYLSRTQTMVGPCDRQALCQWGYDLIAKYNFVRRTVWSASRENRKSMFPTDSDQVRHSGRILMMRGVQKTLVDGLKLTEKKSDFLRRNP